MTLPPLVTAARNAQVVGGRGETLYLELPCRSALNRCTSDRVPFDWTVNPYRGCEFGCGYCFARYTHEYIGLEESRLFETRIYAKTGAAEALERDLAGGRRLRGAIAIGTVTDPYQPAERLLKVTRSLLEVLARHEGLTISLTTKGDLVTRDIDLLLAIGRRNSIAVNMTITTASRRVARLLEPRAPRPARRLDAIRRLARAGVRTGLFIMPIVPGLTDSPASLEAIIGAASRAGVSYVAHQALFLRDSARREFLPFVAEAFPRLAPLLRRAYATNVYHSEVYRRRLDGLIKGLLRKHGLLPRVRSWEAERRERLARAPAPAGRRVIAGRVLNEAQLPLCF